MARQYPTIDNGESKPKPWKLATTGRREPLVPRYLDDGSVAVEEEPAMGKSRRGRRFNRVLLVLAALLLAVTVLPVLALRLMPAWTSSFMLRYQLERAFVNHELPPLEHQWVDWDRIAVAAKLAVIAAEDQRFADHFGLDLDAIGSAIEYNSRHGRRTRGASTITQQTAKNLFLWRGRSWLRKGLEVGYTLMLETAWPKRRILEVYLNVAEFGDGVYGIEAAAERYFRKPASALTYHEAALLAAVLPNPHRYRAAAPSTYVRTRADWIRGQMEHLGTDLVQRL